MKRFLDNDPYCPRPSPPIKRAYENVWTVFQEAYLRFDCQILGGSEWDTLPLLFVNELVLAVGAKQSDTWSEFEASEKQEGSDLPLPLPSTESSGYKPS